MAIQGNGVAVMDPYSERLASYVDVTKRHSPGDGTEPQGGKGVPPADPHDLPPDDEAPNAELAVPPGPTLKDADPATKHQVSEQLLRSQDRLARNRFAVDTHFRRIRANVPFARLEKIPNQSVWVAKVPNGMNKESTAAVPNKADDLCNKVEDTLMADPPKPAPKSHVDDTGAKAAAKLAGEVLNQMGGEAGWNEVQTYRWALSNAFTGASSFLHYVIDRAGGGNQPLQKLAHPLAQDPQNPMVAFIPNPSGAVDETGQPSLIEDRTSSPILRYVSAPSPEAPAGQFVEDAAQADRVWLPGIKIERLRREQVRTFPPTATVGEADAVELVLWCTLAEGRARWPKTVGQMTQEQLLALASWTAPVTPEMIVPYAFRGSLATGATGPALDQVGSFSPLLQRRMFWLLLYIKDSPEYPGGYFCETTGASGGIVLDEGDLSFTVKLPTSGTTRRSRDIPVVQIRPMMDIEGGDPFGWPFISRFAGTSEATANLLAAFADVCDNMVHAHVYLRTTATVDEDDWFDRLTPILLNPNDPEPTYERFPTLPPILELVDSLKKDADTASGLTATAQGLDSENSSSGIAKNLDIRQALISMSGFAQDLIGGMARGWRICLQIMQAEFTTPQLIEGTGEEGSEQTQWWTCEDLAAVDDRVGCQPGTGTMMTPEGKAQYVAFLQGQGWKTPEEAAEIALPSIQSALGLPMDPFKAAIERSIGTFLEGPPEGWVEQRGAYDQQVAEMEAQYAQAPTMVETDMGPQAQPFQPPPSGLFDPFPIRPNDAEPPVAAIYFKRLSKLFVDPQYDAQPEPWKQLAAAAYQRAEAALNAAAAQAALAASGPEGPGGVKQNQQPKPPSGGKQVPAGTPQGKPHEPPQF